jgi:6-phosphogluconolactonase
MLIALLLACARLYAQQDFVFIGSYNWDKTKEGISVYELDTTTGHLKKVISSRNILNPSYLTLSPNGRYVYACTESKTPGAGAVSSFEFDARHKTLTYLNSQKSGGENPVYLSVHQNGRWLVNGNYTEGSLSVYPIAADGSINPPVQHFAYTEGSINTERQDRSHIHAAVFSPNDDYLFLPDLGADKIRCYRFDASATAPLSETQPSFISTSLGSGPRHFTFHLNGHFAYCIEELAGMVSVYHYEHGHLDSIQRIATHTPELQSGFESADIHISPDGHFLYASNRGDENNIAIFSIATNGTLMPIAYQSTYGRHPRIFAIDASGQFLIVANQISGNVIVFKRNAQTGLLKKTGKTIKVRNPSCVQIKHYAP